MAGLTETGLSIKRLPEILNDTLTSQRELIDNSLIASEDTVIGQQNRVIGVSLAQLWELAQAVNDNFNKDKAEGVNLDNLGALIGVFRFTETGSQGVVRFTSEDGVTLSQNTAMTSTNDRVIVTSEEAILSSLACRAASYSVDVVSNNEQYTVIIDDVTVSYTSDADATAPEILNGLQVQLNLIPDRNHDAVVDGTELVITSLSNIPLQIQMTPYLVNNYVVVDVNSETIEPGPIVIPSDTVNSLVIPNERILSLTNPNDFTLGRFRETDEEYRLRFQVSSGEGRATQPAISARLLQVDGVTSAVILENDQIEEDADGRPPKSIEAVVVGGTDDDVAEQLWNSKGAGIETYGNTTIVYIDPANIQREVNFTRPVPVFFAVRVIYDLYDEEVFPDNGQDGIKEVVTDYINALGIDVDLIPKRTYGPLYSNISGIDNIIVEVQEISTPGESPNPLNWQTDRVPISIAQFAQTTEDDVYLIQQ